MRATAAGLLSLLLLGACAQVEVRVQGACCHEKQAPQPVQRERSRIPPIIVRDPKFEGNNCEVIIRPDGRPQITATFGIGTGGPSGTPTPIVLDVLVTQGPDTGSELRIEKEDSTFYTLEAGVVYRIVITNLTDDDPDLTTVEIMERQTLENEASLQVYRVLSPESRTYLDVLPRLETHQKIIVRHGDNQLTLTFEVPPAAIL